MIGADWTALVTQGRAKATGIPWNEKELNAINVLKIPIDFVRGGCNTLEQYDKAVKGESKYQPREVLLQKAKELGIEISEGANPSRADLMVMIEEKSKKLKEVSEAA